MKEITVLFILLRAELWEKEPEDMSLFPLSDTSWENIHEIARRQTVTGLVLRGVCRLPDSLLPPEKLLLRWVAETDAIEHHNVRMDTVLSSLLPMLRRAGLTPVLQKGQGVARFYGEPLLRECGDIDLYFPDKRQLNAASELVKSLGIPFCEAANGNAYYKWDGVQVEHHSSLLDIHNPFLRPMLSEIEEHYGFDEITLPGGTSTLVPAATLDAILLGTHVMKHALGRGIGLRQLCDTALAFHARREDIDGDTIREVGRRAGISGWDRLLYSFLTRHLGLPCESLPYSVAAVPTLPLLRKILAGGNFGLHLDGHSPMSASSFSRKLHTLRSILRGAGFSMRYAPKEYLWMIRDLLMEQARFSR